MDTSISMPKPHHAWFHCFLLLLRAVGELQTDKVSSLSRTYAPTIAAVPGTITMEYKVEGSEFRLNYTSNAALSASDAYTEVYFNEVCDGSGVDVMLLGLWE